MFPIDIKLCCSILGIAIVAMLLNIRKEKARTRSVVFIELSLLRTTMTASMLLIPWQMNVAQATPSTFIPNAVTNRISTPMLIVDDAARKIKGVLESPRAENIPVEML